MTLMLVTLFPPCSRERGRCLFGDRNLAVAQSLVVTLDVAGV